VRQIESLSFSQVFVGIEDLKLGDQPAALKSVGCACADPTASANYRHFHEDRTVLPLLITASA
jgi:hypothetical protein